MALPSYQQSYQSPVSVKYPAVKSSGTRVLNDVSRQFHEHAQDFADQEAIRRGSEEGLRLDFKPTVEIGRASKAYNRAALEVNKSALGSDSIKQLNILEAEAKLNPNIDDAINTFDAKLKGYTEGIMGTTPAANKPFIMNQIAAKGYGISRGLNNIRQQRNLNNGYVQFNDTYGTYLKEMSNNASQGNLQTAMTYHGQLHQLVNQSAALRLLDKNQITNYKKDIDQQLNINDTIGQYKRLKSDYNTDLDDLRKFRTDVLDSPHFNKIFNPKERSDIISLLDKQDREDALKDGLSKERINYEYCIYFRN